MRRHPRNNTSAPSEIRLISNEGTQLGVMRLEAALYLAHEAGTDLIEISPTTTPPVCKLMDFGKYKYDITVKERQARKNQKHAALKEMKLRPKIEQHDYETKLNHITQFLQAGHKVKVTVMFRGREQSRNELGLRLIKRLIDDLSTEGQPDSGPRQEGRDIHMTFSPLPQKTVKKATVH